MPKARPPESDVQREQRERFNNFLKGLPGEAPLTPGETLSCQRQEVLLTLAAMVCSHEAAVMHTASTCFTGIPWPGVVKIAVGQAETLREKARIAGELYERQHTTLMSARGQRGPFDFHQLHGPGTATAHGVALVLAGVSARQTLELARAGTYHDHPLRLPDGAEYTLLMSSALQAEIEWERAQAARLASETEEPRDPADAPPVTLDAQALACFVEDTTRTKTDIIRLLGLRNTQSLAPNRCPKLHAAMKAWRAPDPDRRRIRGSKDVDGNLDAWEDT